MTADMKLVLDFLASDDANDGEANASTIREQTGLTLARTNKALDALRVGGLVVEMSDVQDKHGDAIPVWMVEHNRGWAKVWVLRSLWSHALLPNGRQPLPENDPAITESFRQNWMAP